MQIQPDTAKNMCNLIGPCSKACKAAEMKIMNQLHELLYDQLRSCWVALSQSAQRWNLLTGGTCVRADTVSIDLAQCAFLGHRLPDSAWALQIQNWGHVHSSTASLGFLWWKNWIRSQMILVHHGQTPGFQITLSVCIFRAWGWFGWHTYCSTGPMWKCMSMIPMHYFFLSFLQRPIAQEYRDTRPLWPT